MQNAAGVPSRLVDPAEAEGSPPGSTAPASSAPPGAARTATSTVRRPSSRRSPRRRSPAARGSRVGDVVSLARDGEGWSLALRDGGRVLAGQVVLATGYDTPALTAPLGLELPIEREARHLFFSEPIRERILEPLVVSAERRFAAKQLANGRVLASDLSASGDAEAGRAAWRRRIRAVIEELLPILGYVSFPLLSTGWYDVTPDNHPILGPVDGLPGAPPRGRLQRPRLHARPRRRHAGSRLPCSAPRPDEALIRLGHGRFAGGSLHRELETV